MVYPRNFRTQARFMNYYTPAQQEALIREAMSIWAARKIRPKAAKPPCKVIDIFTGEEQ